MSVGSAHSTGCVLYCAQVYHCRQVCRDSLITLQLTSASCLHNECVSCALPLGSALPSKASSGSTHRQSQFAKLELRTDSSFGLRSLSHICCMERQNHCVFLDELGQEERDTTWRVQSEISSPLRRHGAVKSGTELALTVATTAPKSSWSWAGHRSAPSLGVQGFGRAAEPRLS